MSNYQNLIVEKEDPGIIIVKLNRPKALNALNSELLEELNLLFAEMNQDDSVRGVILTGEGKAFIAGADISEMSGKTIEQGVKFAELGQSLTLKMEKAPFPVIAAVNGYALGGGTEMAISCDFIYASEKAVFGQPEVSLGIIPGYGATVRLSQFVGLPRAQEMILSGRFVKAKEAYEWGLVNKVCSPESLLSETIELAKTTSLHSKPAVQKSKELIYGFCGGDKRESDLKKEADCFGEFFGTNDQKEGMSAFLEKRKPKFQGL